MYYVCIYYIVLPDYVYQKMIFQVVNQLLIIEILLQIQIGLIANFRKEQN